MKAFTLSVFGGPSVGKTEFLKKVCPGTYAGDGVAMQPFAFWTTAGPVPLIIRDSNQVETNVDAGIYFVADSQKQFTGELALIRTQIRGPIVPVWGKSDLPDRSQVPDFLPKDTIPHSSRDGQNLDTPLVAVARVLMNDPTLKAVEVPPTDPTNRTDQTDQTDQTDRKGEWDIWM